MTQHQDDTTASDDQTDVDGTTVESTDESPQYGVGPFSIREVVLAGVWLVAFVVSFFQVGAFVAGPRESLLFGFGSVWTSGLGWILTIGLPTVAVFLIGLRRLSPDGIRRVGSLGIDQFASVAFSVSTVIWLQLAWETVAFSLAGGQWLRSWVIWVELVLMLVGVLLTVFGPLIPPFAEDFRGRREIPAHRNARPVRAVSPRPKPEPRPAAEVSPADYAAEDYAAAGEPGSVAPGSTAATDDQSAYAMDAGSPAETGVVPVDTADRADDGVQTPEAAAPVRHQAFWALVPEERDVVDHNGVALFRIGPTAWALVIEDHGDRFVVRHEDGRVGHLLDTRNVTRG